MRLSPKRTPSADETTSTLSSSTRMLRRLERYGDRVHIAASESLRAILAIDSSVFHLVLEPAPAKAPTAPW